ncbi:redoxin family protein [Kribbella sp. NPDC004875]|uniref:redoxin family protein n=1 Tax=Kribbella sp. NPDC004875 TaxID=3364107 RepID=UPI0036D11B3E
MNEGNRCRTALTRLSPFPASAPDTPAPLDALGFANAWINSEPVLPSRLAGRVVLIDFWTYTCVNWLRTVPYRRAWIEKYAAYGLDLIGVHTPEFEFEHSLPNVRRAIDALGVTYPVAVDNNYAIWTAFDNHYWPALYVVDARGVVRQHEFGEGNYDESELMIQRLLTEAGATGFDRDLVQVDPSGIEVAADWAELRSPENYLGTDRAQNFVSVNGANHQYAAPPVLDLNHWALIGDWTVSRQSVALNHPTGSIRYRFHARDLNLVVAPPASGEKVSFEVRIDGSPPLTAHGADVDAEGNGLLDHPGVYQLIRQPGPVVDRTFEIEFQRAGVHAYSFTFG